MNVVTLIGNLTRDPELRTLPNGTNVCELGVAVNERIKRGDEWEDYASFLDVTVWGKQGENCAEYLTKGRPVGITGRLRQDRWETPEGDKRSKVKITAQSVKFLGGREEGAQNAPQGASDLPVDTGNEDDGDIPF